MPDFVANDDAVVARLDREEIEIVAGPNDICRPLLADAAAPCRLDRVTGRGRHALAAVSRLLGREVRAGASLRLDPTTLSRLRSGFRNGRLRRACPWTDFCTAIARARFRGARLDPAPQG